MKYESNFEHWKSKNLCANSNPNLGQQCKVMSWAVQNPNPVWSSKSLVRGNLDKMRGQILGYNNKALWTQDQIRVLHCSRHLLALLTWIRVWVCTGIFGPSMLKLTFILHIGLISLSIPSFKPWIKFLPSQLDSWHRNQLYWEKVNCSQLTVKPHDFWPTSTYWTHMNYLVKFGP